MIVSDREFRKALDSFRPNAYATARKHLHNRDDAEDATQTAMRRVWANRERVDVETLRGYLCQAAVRAAMDIVRRRKDAQPLVSDGPEGERVLDVRYGYDQFPTTADTIRDARVSEILATVPKQDLQLFALVAEDLTYEEIADRQGLTKSQVQMRLFCARRRAATKAKAVLV